MVQRIVQDKVPSLTIPKTLKEALPLMAELIGNELKVLFQKLLIFIIEFPRDWHFLKKQEEDFRSFCRLRRFRISYEI